MSEVDWAAAAEIFADALELPPPERAAFVATACGRRTALRAAVGRLLGADAAADPGFLCELPGSIVELIRTAERSPERIGAYRIVREIGRGGMGQVLLAERADGQFEQRVAIKLLKRGMDSDAIHARFLRERRILAALEHPNVARLIDGGVADDGRPYFVMEYVEGLPITRYADEHRLDVDARLRLFSTVCTAIEQAHRNLVVHRDLKPANILVTAAGDAKLLDFGIAKALAPHDPDTATQPELGGRLLTPGYAAPEQFRGGAITTATDVYGAGGVLYELLAGRPPFPAGGAAARLAGGMAVEPPLLSDVVPPHLRRRVRGDLETIVATALRSEPERRYPSIELFREDIRRHRERLPVAARGDSAAYRASRFIRRHRIGVGAAVLVAALVLAFGVVSAFQAAQIRREAAAAQEVSAFLTGLFEVADPMTAGSSDSLRAIELLDRGAERIESELGGQPALQARMLGVVGRAFDNLRRSDRAEPLLRRALALEREVSGTASPGVVAALQQLARVQARRGDFRGSERSLIEALAIQERRGHGAGGADPVTWGLLVDLASTLHGTGDPARAAEAVAAASAMFDRIPPGRFRDAPAALARSAELLSYSGTVEQMERVYARLAEVEASRTGPRSVAVAAVYTDWGSARRRRGSIRAADSVLALALAIHRETDSTAVPVAHTLLALADIAVADTAPARADSLYRQAIGIFRRRLGEDHRMVATSRTQLAETLNRSGRYQEAIPLYRQAIATYERSPGDATRLAPPARWRLATALRGAGREAEALEEFAAAIREFERGFPPNYLLTANARRDYGTALVEAGKYKEAEPVLRRAIEVLGERWGEEDARVVPARQALARAVASLTP